jgi:hypothetical protein
MEQDGGFQNQGKQVSLGMESYLYKLMSKE